MYMVDLSQQRILAVDDEPDNLEVFKATLELLFSTTVEVALSAESALNVLTGFKPTCIVTDLSMPKVDGYAFLRALRARRDTTQIPVIALTAHAMSGDKERILDAGFDGYISKPFDVGTLGDQLLECLSRYENQRTA